MTGAVMLSSTVALAAAANFPAPFVDKTGGNLAIVYGVNAQATDFAAVVEINSFLTSELAKMTAPAATATTAASSGVTVTGDNVKLSKPANNINLGDIISDVFGGTLTKSDLPVLLSNGKYISKESNSYEYEQRITLGTSLRLEQFSDSDYKKSKPTVGINLTANQLILNYSLDFTTNPESDIVSSDLADIEGTTIKILGKEYYISDFDNITTTGTGTITLLDTANSATVREGGGVVTVKVGVKSYDVNLDYASTTEAVLIVNGETTTALAEGATHKLADGTYVGIKDIRVRDVAGSVGSVEFSIGSGKLELRGGQNIYLNEKSVSGVKSELLRGTAGSSGRETVDRINIVWSPTTDTFLTSESDLLIPGFKNIKLTMSDLVRGSGETTTVKEGSSTSTVIETTLKNGPETIPILYMSGGHFVGLGKDASNRLATTNSTNLIFNYTLGDRWFVASYNTSSYSESYYLEFANFKNATTVITTDIRDSSGKDLCAEKSTTSSTCTIGSVTLTINQVSGETDRAVNVSINSGGTFNRLFTKSGLTVYLPYHSSLATNNASGDTGYGAFTSGGSVTNSSTGHNSTSFYLIFDEEDRTDNIGRGPIVNVTLGPNSESTPEPEVKSIDIGKATITDPDNSDLIVGYAYSDLATYTELTGKSADQRDAAIKYSGTESFPDVFLTTGDSVVSKPGAATANATTTTAATTSSVKVLGSVSISDGEVAGVDKNLIVVGGSCINKVASDLLGGSGAAVCGSGFTDKTTVGSGQFLIQTFSRSGGKIATLVAGFNAPDTTTGVKYLTTQMVDTSVGKKYVGTSATQATVSTVGTTAAPAAPAAANVSANKTANRTA